MKAKQMFFLNMSEYTMNMKEAIQKFVDAFVMDGGIIDSKISMRGYYVGITNNLELRSKEHNATFITHVKAKSKELAVELEDKLGELGFDNGDRPGNGAEDDTVNVYIYKKTKDTKEHITN